MGHLFCSMQISKKDLLPIIDIFTQEPIEMGTWRALAHCIKVLVYGHMS
jgi:hypothetical protein